MTGQEREDKVDRTPNPGANPDASLPSSVRVLPIVADAPLLPGMATNCYLISTGTGTLVVDPPSGREEALDSIQAAAQEGIEGVLITHTHRDHVGGLGGLVERKQVPVYAHPKARQHLPEGIEFREVREGKDIAGWQVFYTPGHRADSVTFYSRGSGCAIVGDLVAGFGTVVISPPDGDLGDYLDSLRRLRDEIRPTLLAPGHGPLIDEPEILLSYYINHRLTRERLVIDALSETPRSLQTLLPNVYADTDPSLYPLAKHSLLAHLLKLQREGRARETEEGWILE
ncbi:MAG: MBL fold metallo-hydrolase [Chloroflexota bacterium]|nr:MBL fold metallo-hydrolase [Chloroflexota bacterium]